MKAEPLFENVLIKPLPVKKQTKSGILLPENKNMDEPIEGVIVAVGPGDEMPVAISGIGGMQTIAWKKMVVKEGQHVVFKQYAATPIKINNEKHYLLNQRDILSIIKYEGTAQSKS